MVVVLAAGLLTLPAAPAAAHATLQSSDPAPGAELGNPPDAVVLEFTEEPDASLSSFRVRTTQGGRVDEAPAVRAKTVTIPLAIARGVYVVEWRVVSRIDGHLTAGTFAFGFGEAPSDVTDVAPPREIPPLGVAGRFVLLAGLALLIGSAWVCAGALRDIPAGGARLLGASILLSVTGLVMLAESQRQSASVGYPALISTFLGRALVFRAAGIVAAALSIAAALKLRDRSRRIALAFSAVFASAAMLAHVVAGHAGAVDSLKWLKVASQWAHFSAAGIWIGGLAGLLIGLRGSPSEDKSRAVRRYSFVAGMALAIVVATGTFRAINGVGSWSALFGTGYGRLVILKVALLIGLAALGAINRYRNIPRSGRSLTGLRRVSRIEILMAVFVLAATALLANLSPPTTAGPASPAGIVARGSDFADTTRVRLDVTPGNPGINLFAVKVEPVLVERVSLRFEFPGDPDIAGSTLELKRGGAGLFRSRGGNLSVDGPWRVIVLVQTRDDAMEIPLILVTPCRAKASRVSGQPTLFDTRLPGGRSAQGYVDPGRAGDNEVHFTFFDAGGVELSTGPVNTILATKAGEEIINLTSSKLSTGHFIAPAKLSQGQWRFDITTEDSEGMQLRACFEERISQT